MSTIKLCILTFTIILGLIATSFSQQQVDNLIFAGKSGGVVTQNGASVWVENATVKIFQDTTQNSELHTIPGNAKKINLRIAQNGLDFFQVVVTTGTNNLYGISVTVSDLVSANNTISTDRINLFLEYYINVRSQSYEESILDYTLGLYPDALVPLTSTFDVEAEKNQPLWVQVYVPNGTSPGIYTGTISFSGGVTDSVSLTVEVLNFTIPSKTGLHNPGYADFWIFDEDGDLSEAEYEVLVKKYTQFFSDHDINLGESIDAFDVLPTLDDNDEWQFDTWREGLDNLIVSGLSDFTPIVLNVPFDFEMLDEDLDSAAKPEVQESYVEFLNAFKEYIKSQPSLFKDNIEWVVWITDLDEPHTEEMAWLIARYAVLTNNATDQDIQFHYEVDGGIDWTDPMLALDLEIDPTGWTNISDKWTVWAVPQEELEFNLDFVQEQIATSRKVILYEQAYTAIQQGEEELPNGIEDRDYEFPSLPGVVNPALFHRVLPWFVWKYQMAGVGFWAVMYWYDERANSIIDAWTDDPAIRIKDWGGRPYRCQNGDGWLVYPGNKVTDYTGQDNVEGPVSSLRLELFRKGLEDYKYLSILEQSLDNFEENTKTQAEQLLSNTRNLLKTISSFDRDAQKYDNLLWSIKQLLNSNGASLNTTLIQSWDIQWNPTPIGPDPPYKSTQGFTYLIVLGAFGVLVFIVKKRKGKSGK